jgi:phosphatidylglycerophosphate synthase
LRINKPSSKAKNETLSWHLNFPNSITLLRLVFAALTAWLLLIGNSLSILIAGILLTLGWITDGLDGWVARKTGQSTLFGALFDLFADRILMTPALIILVFGGHWHYGSSLIPFSPFPYLIVVVMADITVLAGIFVFMAKRIKRQIEFPGPTLFARITYSIQMPTLIIAVTGIGNDLMMDILMILTILSTVIASYSYLKKGGYVFTS